MRTLILMLLFACGHAATDTMKLPPQLTAPRSTLVLGDVHGTQEMPAFVGRVVAALADTQPVVLGLEIRADEAPGLPAFLASDGGPAARAALVRDPFWQSEYQDGRRSLAMLELIDSARRLRAAGKRVELDLFDAALPGEPEQESREEAMAQHLIATRAAHREAILVVYVGNLHAVRTEHEALPGFTWMVGRMLRAGMALLSLGPRTQGGTAWVCHGNDAADCGPSPVHADGGPPGFSLGTTPQGRYDGWYDVGPVHASPPAAFPDKPRTI